MLTLHSDGPVECPTMARTAFGRPLYTVKIYVIGRARDLLQAGQPLESIRDQVLGPEGSMTVMTRGHF